MSGGARLLIVDDEPMAVKNLAHALTKVGHSVVKRTSGAGGLEALERERFDVVLTDLRMERVDGMTVLKRAHEVDPDLPVVMITGYASLPSAVEAMKAGAYHYIAKPFRLDEVREVVAKAFELISLKRENRRLREQVDTINTSGRIISQNPVMRRLLQTAKDVAPTDSNVLILGESGTGKELVARYLHLHSGRKDGPFVAVNCGAFQEELLANELFGHEKGAFTGATENKQGLIEAANGGTLFLDEIAEMSLAMQIKLLRVIQEREVLPLGATRPRSIDVRFIAATLRDLRGEVAAGRFRQDLYYRLDVVSFFLPPLADRRDDIPLLAFYFLKKHAVRMDKSVGDIDPEAMELLCHYDYPGNIRELENVIERGVALSRGATLSVRSLPPVLVDGAAQVIRRPEGKLMTLEEHEEDYIRWVLERTDGNRTKAAEILGIARVSLWRRLKKMGLELEE